MGPRWGHYGARWSPGGPRWDQDGAKIGQDGPTEVAKTVQDGAKIGQDAAKTRENESKKCGHSRQIRCFRKVGTIQRQRRANNVLMKQVLVTGLTDRREKKRLNVAIVGVQKCAGGWELCKMDPKWIEHGSKTHRNFLPLSKPISD